MRRAAASAAEHGRTDVAEALLARAEAAGGDRKEEWHRRRLRLAMALQAGDAATDVEDLRSLADEMAGEDPALAAEVLLDALPSLVRAVRVEDCRAFATEAAALAERGGDERLARRADVALGVALSAVADAGGPPRLARYREVLAEEGARRSATFLVEVVAPCLTFFEREPEVDELFAAIEEDLREQGSAPGLVQVLGARALACHRRDLPRAAAYAQEAVDLAAAIDRPGLAALAASEVATATALMGDRARCVPVAEWLLATGVPGLGQNARTALALLSLAEGDLDTSLAIFEEQRHEVGLATGLVRWEIDWCEALVLARRAEEAAAVLEAVVSSDQALLGAGGFTRVRGMLTEELDEAEALFDSARQWYRLVGNRTGEGRTELIWGERLRRVRRRAAARAHLERAVELLEGTGAEIWAARARRELTAAGGARTGAALGIDALTDQELAIARMAVAGSTNQTIGSSLFLSPRTVETHLSSVFRKLGVANRRELSALAVDEPQLR
jgi:DNA-binding CsgD family transcriptional regulator